MNEAFDLSVMVSWAFEKATIAEQALSIEKDRFDLKEYQPMLKLKAFRGEIPLFLVHPGLGGAETYTDLSNVINQDQPLMSALYGVESYNLYNLEQPITHMALLAAKYIEYIKSIQNQGPYFIGGWSLGGTLSYEVARQLKDNGDRVLGVYLIDTLGLGPEVWKKLEAMSSRDHSIAGFKEMEVPNEHIKRLLKLQPIESKLLSTYSLSVLEEVEVVLLNAMNRQTSKDKELDNMHKKIELLTHLPNNGWDPYAQNLTVHEFDADHGSIMLDTNHLKRVVKIIEEDMSRKIKVYLESKPLGKQD